MTARTVRPGDLERDLVARLAAIEEQLATRARHHARPKNPSRKRAGSLSVLTLGIMTMALGAMFATSVLAVVNDAGVVDIQTNSKDECPIDTTDEGAIIQFVGQGNNTECDDLGASGSGIFESFVRVQNTGSEQGYNTDAAGAGLDFQFDEVGGNFTHSILVSDIPVVSEGGALYWELFSDINESNANNPPAPHLSLNDVEVWYVTDCGPAASPEDPCPILDYPFSAPNELVYDFEGDILVNDANAGSGEADIRYLIPLAEIEIPADCGFKDPDCEVFFVLYSQWGLSEDFETEDGEITDYPSDATFEEWKVKTYPFVTVEKTAEAEFTRTFLWTIDKSVDPAEWDLFTGDTGTSLYTVAVTKDAGTDTDPAVSGDITITNTGELDAIVTSVTDEISGGPTAGDVDCPVALPTTLDPGETLVCSYGADLPDASDQTNTATVTLEAGTTFTAEADVDFGEPTSVVNDTINVTDTFAGDLGEFSDTGSTTYERTFECDDDEGDHDNTATIVETDQSDDASVTVNCHALTVTKDAVEGFTRTYEWDIDKTSPDPTELTLNPGQTYDYPYEVTVSVLTFTDSALGVSGDIDVTNPAPIDALINNVSDIISPAIVADVECGVTFPYTLVAGDTLECTYSADLPDGIDRTNTATATLQNHDYHYEDDPVASGTTDFSGTADVDFEGAGMTEIDECIDVTDSLQGDLGEVCIGDAPKTFTYERTISVTEEDCEGLTIMNTASFETNDTGATGSDDHTVIVTVPCEEGCTLTQGYWKTHSIHGPASKADPTWDLLPNGPDTEFFLSGQTWYEVFWTAPKKGNAYYILAHQYMAAKLNILSGATSTASVDAAITWAETFFSTYTPDNWPKGWKNQIVQNAGILGSYNEGLIGPGHCDEDSIALAGNLARSSTTVLR